MATGHSYIDIRFVSPDSSIFPSGDLVSLSLNLYSTKKHLPRTESLGSVPSNILDRLPYMYTVHRSTKEPIFDGLANYKQRGSCTCWLAS